MNYSLRKITAVFLSVWIFSLAAGVHLLHNHAPLHDRECCSHSAAGHDASSPEERHIQELHGAGSAGEKDHLRTACSACSFLNQYKVPRRDVSPANVIPAVISVPLPLEGYYGIGNFRVLSPVPRAPPLG